MTDTLHPSIQSFLDTLEYQGKSRATIDTYRRGVTHFIRWSEQSYGQSFDPAQIIPRDIEDWMAYQQTVEKAKPTTINSRLMGTSRYFKWAMNQNLTRKNPTADASSLRLESRHPKALDKAYVRRLLRSVNNSENLRDIAIVECLLGTGLRISELLNLKMGDVVLNERSGTITIRRGKGKIHRTIPLTKNVRQALQNYLDEDGYLKAWLQDHHLNEDTPFWIGERGPLKDRSGSFYMLKKHARLADLDPNLISAHVLRHTFATRYLEANPDDLRGLAAILGHASMNTVMVYTEPSTEDLAARMEGAEVF